MNIKNFAGQKKLILYHLTLKEYNLEEEKYKKNMGDNFAVGGSVEAIIAEKVLVGFVGDFSKVNLKRFNDEGNALDMWATDYRSLNLGGKIGYKLPVCKKAVTLSIKYDLNSLNKLKKKNKK